MESLLGFFTLAVGESNLKSDDYDTYILSQAEGIPQFGHYYFLDLKADQKGTYRLPNEDAIVPFTWVFTEGYYKIKTEKWTHKLTVEESGRAVLVYVENLNIVNYEFKRAATESDWNLISNTLAERKESVVAMNNNKWLAKVEVDNKNQLTFELGRLLSDDSIRWLNSEALTSFGQGTQVSVSFNDEGSIGVSYTATDGIRLKVGNMDRIKNTIDWGQEVLFAATGHQASICLNPYSKGNEVVIVYEDQGVKYRMGTYNYSKKEISWKGVEVLASIGFKPGITFNNNGDVVAVYHTDSNEVACVYGMLGSAAISWESPHWIQHARSAAVAINNYGEGIITYEVIQQRAAVAYSEIRIRDTSIDIGTAHLNGYGVRSQIGVINAGDVIEARIKRDRVEIIKTRWFREPELWMGKIAVGTALSELSLPGTHDSGALYGKGIIDRIARCQEMFVVEQLDAGIRFFDIRVKLENTGDLVLYHGPFSQYYTLAQVIDDFTDFLQTYPSESIILSIKNENDPVNDADALLFEEAINLCIAANEPRWYLENKLPLLEEVRAKIFLFRRYRIVGTEPKGLDVSQGWEDDAVFMIGDSIKIQDKYKTTWTEVASVKWPLVETQLKEAISGSGEMQYINFLSASGTLFEPRDVAWGSANIPKGINTYFEEFIHANPVRKRLGWVLFDYPSHFGINGVIQSNF